MITFFRKKVTLKEAGLLDGMTDFHCHLLPGVDDGIQTIEETLAILHYYEEIGIKKVWFTSHVMEDIPNSTEKLLTKFGEVKEQYQGNIEIFQAAEYMLDEEYSSRLEKNDILPLGENENQVLVETSTFSGPRNMEGIFNRTKSAGYFPILAHPERYSYMNKEDYLKWKSQDIKFQLNLPSLQGFYGKVEKGKAEWMLRNDMYDYYGTDAHTTRHIGGTKLPLSDFTIDKKLVTHIERLIKNARF